MSHLIDFKPNELELIKATIADPDITRNEFDLFISMCRSRGLNPLTRQVYPFLFHKDDPKKRQLVLVVSIDGYRSLAARTGDYRPDEKPPRIKASKKEIDPDTNPKGIISAEVSVFKFAHGAWHPAPAISYWDEMAPIEEIWAGKGAERKPTGKFRLNPKKDGWRRMPRLMLAKTAEMAALRRAFPDVFGGLYTEEETHAETTARLASQIMIEAAQERMLGQLGGPGFAVDWLDGNGIQSVPKGRYVDESLAFLQMHQDDPAFVQRWREQNMRVIREYFTHDKSGGLRINQEVEKIVGPVISG